MFSNKNLCYILFALNLFFGLFNLLHNYNFGYAAANMFIAAICYVGYLNALERN